MTGSGVIESFKKFGRLSPFERRTLLLALWMLPMTACALRMLGLQRCHSLLIRLVPRLGEHSSRSLRRTVAEARVAARMIEIASQCGLYRARCLQKSLVLWWVMRSRGLSVDVWFGVHKDESGVDAHAWVEHAGVVLNDRDDVHERFVAFKSQVSSAGMHVRHAR